MTNIPQTAQKIRDNKEAAVSLILLKDNQVLLLKRHNTGWADGYYALVGGCVEAHESIRDAMIREAQEEAHITIHHEWLTFGCVMDARIIGRSKHTCLDFFFICTRWEGEITNKEPHKHEDMRFFPLNDLPKELLPPIREAIFHALEGTRYTECGWKTHLEIR